MIHENQEYILQVTFTRTVSYLDIRVSTNLKKWFHYVCHAYKYMSVGLPYSRKGVLNNTNFCVISQKSQYMQWLVLCGVNR